MFPRSSLKRSLSNGVFLFFLLWFTLGALGPLLSFFSLQKVGYSEGRALLYSVLTFFLDGLNVFLLSLIFRKFLSIGFQESLRLATLTYSPLWLFDFFDVSQSLRSLSNLGLILSLYVLYRLTGGREFLKLSAVHVFLYGVNGFIAELTASSPLFVKVVESF